MSVDMKLKALNLHHLTCQDHIHQLQNHTLCIEKYNSTCQNHMNRLEILFNSIKMKLKVLKSHSTSTSYTICNENHTLHVESLIQYIKNT
jgi:hypothetical protein